MRGDSVAKNLEMVFLMDVYGPALTQKQREVLEYYYCDDLSLAEISQNSGISRQGVRDSIKRGEGIMLELEQELGFAGRLKIQQQDCERILASAELIKNENNAFVRSDTIAHEIEKIIAAVGELESDD